MANGTSGTRSGGAAGGTISPAKVHELENTHQKSLEILKNANGSQLEADWEKGSEVGAREILSDLAGKNYSVSGYQLKQTGSYDPISVAEVEANLDKKLQGYENAKHTTWDDGYFGGAVVMLEQATGNKYSVSGYKLKKVSTPAATKPKAKSKPITQAQLVSLSTATLKKKLKTATGADKKKIQAELMARGMTSNID